MSFKYGNFATGSLVKKVAVNGVLFDNYLRVTGENLHRVTFVQFLNTSTWARAYDNTPLDPELFVPGFPAGAPFLNTNGEWKLDWAEQGGQIGEMTPAPLGSLGNRNTTALTPPDQHTLGPNPTQVHGGHEITFLAGGTRDFKVVFMNSANNDPLRPLATFHWGYRWDNNSYTWTNNDAPPAPVQLCASPTRNGAGPAMVTGYGEGTNGFTGFEYVEYLR